MILIVDESESFRQEIADILSVSNPGFKEFMGTDGSAPYEGLDRQDMQMCIIAQPQSSIIDDDVSLPTDHATEWIETIRWGNIWNMPGGKQIVRKQTTKKQLPIIYIHKYNPMDEAGYPRTFPDTYRQTHTLSQVKQFAEKWYKSVGATVMLWYPWKAQDLAVAFNQAISFNYNHVAGHHG